MAIVQESIGWSVQVLTWLLSVPGASKTVLEARIPYGGGKSMAEILAKEPQTYACTLTAVDMARAAYRQAAHLSEFGVPILGVSCTCALATDRVKKGDHKVRFPGPPTFTTLEELKLDFSLLSA